MILRGANLLTGLQKPKQKQNTAWSGRWEWVRLGARRPSGRKEKEGYGLEVREGWGLPVSEEGSLSGAGCQIICHINQDASERKRRHC